MDDMTYYRHADFLNVFEIAMLLVGENPKGFDVEKNISKFADDDRKLNYYRLLTGAAENHLISHDAVRLDGGEGDIDWIETKLSIGSLKKYLTRKGLCDNFFFVDQIRTSGYDDPQNEFYTAKLSAAVAAWTAVTRDTKLRVNRSPKQALVAWLELNAQSFGLVLNDGSKNKQAIDEVAKVANWQPTGGAVSTPTRDSST